MGLFDKVKGFFAKEKFDEEYANGVGMNKVEGGTVYTIPKKFCFYQAIRKALNFNYRNIRIK